MSVILVAAVFAGVTGHPVFAQLQMFRIEVALYPTVAPVSRDQGEMLEALGRWEVVTRSGQGGFCQGGGHFIEVLPIGFPKGKVYLEVNVNSRSRNPGRGGRIDAQHVRESRVVTQGQRFVVRLDATSPTDQSWAVFRVTQAKP